jgi:hypothetical protein
MIAWAWGISRLIDALEAMPEAGIDPTQLGVMGCSRNGKGALIAGRSTNASRSRFRRRARTRRRPSRTACGKRSACPRTWAFRKSATPCTAIPASQAPMVTAFARKFLRGEERADTNVLATDGNYTLDEERWVDWDVPALE